MDLSKIKYDQNGLVAAVAQHFETGEVLMLAWMNAQALQLTLKSGKATFWSRSRQSLWVKGETSGNYLFIKDVYIDCDQDAVLLKVQPVGPACHTGAQSCFYRKIEEL
jgi:phosphoribosyl-AMP cyclohydrolase